jgi:hypothetical protein
MRKITAKTAARMLELEATEEEAAGNIGHGYAC